jgi:hypothetical protein
MSTVLGNQNASLFISSSKIALQLDELDVISIQHGQDTIDLNGYKIINATSAGSQGLITQSMGDARYYLNTVTLDAIAQPLADLSLNSHKITGLADPTDA